jgi:hypothetical protein
MSDVTTQELSPENDKPAHYDPPHADPVPQHPAPAPTPSLASIVAAVLAAMPAPPAAKVSDEHATLLADAAPVLSQLAALQTRAEAEGHSIVSILETVGRQVLGIFR